MFSRREGWSWGQSWVPPTPGAECPDKPGRGRAVGVGGFATKGPAGPGRLSWQRKEACLAGPGLPWGQPLLGLQCSAQPMAQPGLGLGWKVPGDDSGVAPASGPDTGLAPPWPSLL